jgi:putative membrane protein
MNGRNFIIRLVINMIALSVTAALLPGIHINGGAGTLLIVALVFGIINSIVKPILLLLTCPFVIITLGLFILVINGLMLLLTAAILGNSFVVDGFGTAIIGGIVMGIAAMVVEWILGQAGMDDRTPARR